LNGLTRTPEHKYSWDGGPLVPGVTSIIKMLDKSGPLVGWAKREAAACAVRNLEMVTTMVNTGGPDAAIKWVASIPDFQRDKAADLGTRVHTLAEAISRGQDITVAEDEAPFIESYMRWRDEHQPRVLHAEYMVYSEKHHYGGTADMVAHIGSDLWLIDAKTGRGVYAETALQLAALHYADFAGKPGDPTRYRLPKATRFGVLHVRPEGAELIPYDVGKQEFAAFLACRTLYDWQEKRAPVVKQPIAVKEAA
jgi:hypothetical protein